VAALSVAAFFAPSLVARAACFAPAKISIKKFETTSLGINRIWLSK